MQNQAKGQQVGLGRQALADVSQHAKPGKTRRKTFEDRFGQLGSFRASGG